MTHGLDHEEVEKLAAKIDYDVRSAMYEAQGGDGASAPAPELALTETAGVNVGALMRAMQTGQVS